MTTQNDAADQKWGMIQCTKDYRCPNGARSGRIVPEGEYAQKLEAEIAQLRATNARLAAALEESYALNVNMCDGAEPETLAYYSEYKAVIKQGKAALTPDALDDLRVIREVMDAIDCGCTDDNCWRREAYAALKERFGGGNE